MQEVPQMHSAEGTWWNPKSLYEATDGKKQKTSMESFADTRLMVFICWHDVPHFFANINTPDE